MKKWRSILAAGMAGIMALGLVGCGNGKQEKVKNNDEKVKIQIAASGSNEELELRKNIGKLYTDKNPNVELEWIDLGTERMQKIMTLIGSGQVPDLLYVNEYYYYPLAEKGVLEPLSQYVKDDKDFDISRFNKALIEDFAYYKDELYGLPQEVSPFVIYYNKDMFEQANIELPTDDWTMEEFTNAAVQLTDKENKVYGYLHPSLWSQQAVGWFYREGSNVFSDDGTSIDLDSPEALTALNTLYDLVVEKQVSPDPAEVAAMGDDGYNALFRNQKAAMYMSGAWDLTTYDAAPLDFEWDVVLPPKSVNQQTAAASLFWSVSKDSKNKDIAWDILKTFTSPEAEKMIAEFHMALPSTNDKEALEVFTDVETPANIEAFVKAAEVWSLNENKSPKTKEVLDAILNEMDLMLLEKQTPEETQRKFVKESEEILEK